MVWGLGWRFVGGWPTGAGTKGPWLSNFEHDISAAVVVNHETVPLGCFRQWAHKTSGCSELKARQTARPNPHRIVQDWKFAKFQGDLQMARNCWELPQGQERVGMLPSNQKWPGLRGSK